MKSILDFFHGTIGLPWAWSIVALTILVRIVLVPLTVRQIHSMQALQAHAPEMKAIQQKYKGDRAKLNEELMKFYRENHINPAASCLPLLAQFPVFIALYFTLKHYSDHINGSWLYVVPNISDKGTAHWSGYLLLAIYAGSQIASTYFMGATMDKTQRNIMMVLPLALHHGRRAVPGRPDHLLDDDEPLDGRPGPRHAPARAEDEAPKARSPPRRAPKRTSRTPREGVRQRRGARRGRSRSRRRRSRARQAEEGRLSPVRRRDPSRSPSRRPARPSARRSGRRCATSSARRPGSTRRACASRSFRRESAACSASASRPPGSSHRRRPRPARRRRPRTSREPARLVRELVERVVGAIGVVARVDVREDDEEIVATCTGGDLGVLIGSTARRSTRCNTSRTPRSTAAGAQAGDGRRRGLPRAAAPDARRDRGSRAPTGRRRASGCRSSR